MCTFITPQGLEEEARDYFGRLETGAVSTPQRVLCVRKAHTSMKTLLSLMVQMSRYSVHTCINNKDITEAFIH